MPKILDLSLVIDPVRSGVSSQYFTNIADSNLIISDRIIHTCRLISA